MIIQTFLKESLIKEIKKRRFSKRIVFPKNTSSKPSWFEKNHFIYILKAINFLLAQTFSYEEKLHQKNYFLSTASF